MFRSLILVGWWKELNALKKFLRIILSLFSGVVCRLNAWVLVNRWCHGIYLWCVGFSLWQMAIKLEPTRVKRGIMVATVSNNNIGIKLFSVGQKHSCVLRLYNHMKSRDEFDLELWIILVLCNHCHNFIIIIILLHMIDKL